MGTLALLLMCCFGAMVYTISGDEEADTAADMVAEQSNEHPQRALAEAQLNANKEDGSINQHLEAVRQREEEDCDEEKQDLKDELNEQIEELEKRLDKMKDRKLFES